MPPKEISSTVLEKIKKEHIAPKPKWQFLLKKSVLWGSFVLTLLFGGLSMSLIILMVSTNDWEILEHTDSSMAEFLFVTLPHFWMILFLLFLFISLYNIKHTSGGYRFHYLGIILLNLGATFLLGFAFLGMGVAHRIDTLVTQNVPYYEEMVKVPRFRVWMRPEEGMVAGKIKNVQADDMVLVDIDRKEWLIIITDLPEKMRKQIEINKLIGVFGDAIDENTIHAVRIKILPPMHLRALPDVESLEMMKEMME
jgi:hypothetical protein